MERGRHLKFRGFFPLNSKTVCMCCFSKFMKQARLISSIMYFNFRRGAAYGLAGIIKGLGILSLKQHDVMNVLATSMQDKKNYKHREGKIKLVLF